MGDQDRSDAPTAVERPGGSAPSTPDTSTDPSISPIGAALSTSAFDPPDDRFEMRSELGRGGMGRVDEAFDRALGRPVAIKHMLSPSGTELARFEREARITARLEHPGIVPIHDAGRSADGTPYYVMRRVDGLPLSEVAKGKSLDERLAIVPNLLAACDAVAFAHARGVIHRDIKPTNILIGPFGETLLIDWGLAREIASDAITDAPSMPSQPDLTRAGTVAGTPGFMSPEQARGEGVDARADVFALGVTLFYVLAGRLPWTSSSATEMINAVGGGNAAAWHLLPAEVPLDLRAVVEKAMAPDLTKRYADAGALAADLRRFITGNLVGAYQYGRLARLLRFARRHRAALVVAVVSLILVAVVATISVRRVLAERDDAKAAHALAEQRQREATDVADGLLVDTARQLATTDPTAAITKLRQLSPASSHWREAWAAASTAWFKGIPFGFVTEPGPGRVQTSIDSRFALIVSFKSGTIVLLDLVARTRRDLKTVAHVWDCSWFDATRSIACSTRDSMIVIDVASGGVRDLGLGVASFESDRQSRLLLYTNDRRVLELRPDSAPVEIARDVTDYAFSGDLEWRVFVRGTAAELRHGDQVWALPYDASKNLPPSYDVRAGRVTILTYDEIHVYQVVGADLRHVSTARRSDYVLAIASVAGYSYVVDPNGASNVAVNGIATTWRTPVRNVFHTRGGFIIGAEDGSIIVRDETGWFEIGKRPLVYQSIDQTSDNRFVVAHASGGDLLVWDLDGPRGNTVLLEGSETVGQIGPTDLWTADTAFGVLRHPLPRGEHEIIIPAGTPVARFEFDANGHWVAMTDNGRTAVYDTKAKRTHVLEAWTNLAAQGSSLTYAFSDGTVWRWSPAANTPAQLLGKLAAKPMFLAAAPRFVIVVVGDSDAVRLHVETGAMDRSSVRGEIVYAVTEIGGRAWLLADGVVWRWDLGAGAPVEVATEEPVRNMIALDDGVLLHGTKSLTLQKFDGRQQVSASAGGFRLMSDDLLLAQSPTMVVSVIDLVTAKSFDLPMRAMSAHSLVASGNRVGMTTGHSSAKMRFTYWDLSVPREPAALQRWLATITNARPIPGSDAVAWPRH